MTRGVVAVGDSITNACSRDLALAGMEPLSWAQRVGQGFGLPIEVHARPGASSSEIRRDLLPAVRGEYDVALVYVGVNNIISWRTWRREDLRADLDALLTQLRRRASRVLVMGYPSTLGRAAAVMPYGPGLAKRVAAANDLVTAVARQHDVLHVAAPPLSGHQVWMDGVHPTSLGHLEMARSALAALGRGAAVPPAPAARQPLDEQYLRWRRRQSIAFALREPPRGIGKWMLARQ